MKSGSFVLSLLASVAVAQPHGKHLHKHQARHQVIEWVTEWAVETEVVAVTQTVWVDEGSAASTTLATSTTSSKKVPAQFFQPVSKSTSSSSPSSTSSPTPSSSSVDVVPPPVSTTPVQAPPVPSTTSVVEVSTSSPPASEPAQAQVPEAKIPIVDSVSTTTPATAPTSAPGNGGSSGGPCSQGSACTGDITHYDAGLGACGWTTNGDSENVVALSHLLMGTQSNGNPYCGKTVTISLNGKTVTAKVVDKCMGCAHDDLDLSNQAFKELEDMGVGRTKASWYFN